jgi:hypothetical protein
VNGSYRDFVPDIYQSGYQMITWAAISRDPSIWNKAISFSGEQPFMINPVNLSLRKNGNLTKKSLYNETFDTLTSIWSRNLSGTTAYEQLNPAKKKEYINYYSPVDAGNGIAAIKTSLSEPPRFVLISNTSGKEKVIHRPGYMNPMLISYGAGMIVWVETRPDVRWENRDYSVIMIHDINSGTTRKISHHTRYPAASISADGKIICAIENTVDNSNSLVFIDAASGNIIKSVPSPGNAYLQRPQWSESSKITVISLTAKGEGILSYTTATGKWDVLKEESPEDLQSCFLRNDSLFYVSSVSGTENVYLQTRGGLKQITHSRFGATDPSLKGNRIIFSDYNSQGNSVCYTETGNATALSETADNEEFLIDKLKNKKDVTGIDISKNYKPQPYRKWQHLFRFHSWMPFYADIDRIQSDPLLIRPGITLMSQNTLSSLISTIGYEYTAEKRNVLHSKVSWKGWFPVFEATYDYGNYPAVFGTPRTIQPATNFSGGVILPFRFSTGRFSQFIRPSFTTYYTRDIYQVGDGVYDYEQTKLACRLYLSNYSRYAARDIYPKWAQIVDFNYRFSPFDKQIFGTTAYVKTAFFFPGLFRDNGIRIRFEKEKQDQSKYIFGNSILFPRGLNTHIISRSLTFLSADYVFPVAYPDFNISSLFYLKRIRSGLFYDYASGTRNRYFNPSALHTNAEHFRSFGIELLGDFHLLRIPFMMSGGVQAAWKELGQAPHFGVLFNIDIYGFSVGKRQQ